jgi:DNA-directed RNA polymerase specialized sigma24 family protein
MSALNAALAGLYQAHATELHEFARRRVGRQEAEDVVQDTFLHLLQRGNAATLEHPRPYLFRIAANLAVDLARKTKVRLRYGATASRSPAMRRLRPVPKPPPEGRSPVRRFYDGSPEPTASAAPMILGELDRGLVRQNGIEVRNGFDFRIEKHAEISFPRSIGVSW